MRVRIKDFQALKAVDIEVSGITEIVGENNVGKSATIRAILAALSGRMGEDFVRVGAKKSVVGLEFLPDPDNADPLSLAWVKGKGGAQYVLNEEPMERLGRRGVPLEELAAHGLKEIEFSGGRDRIQFWTQRTPPFLVSLPPTQVFDFVSRVLEERKIIPVIQEMVKDLGETKENVVRLEGAVQAHTTDLDAKSKELEAERAVMAYEPLVAQASHVLTELNELQFVDAEALRRMEYIQRLQASAAEGRGKTSGLTDLLTRGFDLVKSIQILTEAGDRLVTFGALEARFRDASRARDVYTGVSNTLSPLVSTASTLYQECLTLTTEAGRLAGAIKSLTDITTALTDRKARMPGEIPKEWWGILTAVRDLEIAEGGIRAQEGLLAQADKAIESAKNGLQAAKASLEKTVDEIGVCPLCGATMGKESHVHGS